MLFLSTLMFIVCLIVHGMVVLLAIIGVVLALMPTRMSAFLVMITNLELYLVHHANVIPLNLSLNLPMLNQKIIYAMVVITHVQHAQQQVLLIV